MTSGVTDLGSLAESTPMTVHVVLALRSPNALHQDIAAGDVLSAAAFEQQYSPTTAQVSKVESYLRSEGLTTGAVTANRLFVSATGPASAIERAFDTSMER